MSGRSAEQINAPTTSSRTSSSAWGKTGRVTLTTLPLFQWAVTVWDPIEEFPGARACKWVGTVFDNARIPCPGWAASVHRNGAWVAGAALTTRDEAVMWVLRRARPDVWREERPVVWKVWTHPRPADPFGPAGWQWLGGPDKDTTMLWAGPQTGRGQREWIIKNAHYRAVCDYERQRAS